MRFQTILMRVGIWVLNKMSAESGMKLASFYFGGLLSNYPGKKRWKLREGIIKMIDDAVTVEKGSFVAKVDGAPENVVRGKFPVKKKGVK